MAKNPTTWTPENNEPAGFTPYGPSTPAVFTNNDGGAPTIFSHADTKNPTTLTGVAKSPGHMGPTYGIKALTYDTLGASYDDVTVTYDQTQENLDTPVSLATSWSPV